MPQYKNILIALDGQMAEKTMMAVKEAFLQVFENYKDRLQVGRLDFVDNKEDVDRIVSGVDYDVLLITERIRGVNIGAGSIKTWQKKNRLLDIILFLAPAKKGGEKVRALHKEGYYNAVYSSDLKHSSVIVDIILNGRTAGDAALYYGIDEAPAVFDEVSTDFDLSGNSVVDASVKSPELQPDVLDRQQEQIQETFKQAVAIEDEEGPVSYAESTDDSGTMVHSQVVIEESALSEEVTREIVTDSVVSAQNEEVGKDSSFVTPADEISSSTEENWLTGGEEYSIIEESPDGYTDSVNEGFYAGYEQRSEVSVFSRKVLDASVLGGEPAVMVRSRIATVVSDTVMVIECPNGGLMKNKGLIENRVVTLLM